MKTIGRDFGDTARKVYAVASGALGNGKTCVVNSNGTVSVVAQEAAGGGTAVVFEDAIITVNATTFDSNSNRIVIGYRDGGNSNYGTAVVATVSGSSISFGSPVVFEAARINAISATFDSNSNKVVFAYVDDGNSDRSTAVVGTVDPSDNSISFGTPVQITTNNTESDDNISCTFDSNSNKVVVAYKDTGNSQYGTAVVGTVSGTGISFGTPVVFESDEVYTPAITFDSNSNKVVIAFADKGSSQFYGKAIVGTVSGTGISFGSLATFESANTGNIACTFDSTANKVCIVYDDNGNSSAGTAVVATVSGTSISFGTAVVFNTGSTNGMGNAVVFDSTNGKVIIFYSDGANSQYLTGISGTISGTSISFSSEIVVANVATNSTSAGFDSTSGKAVFAYRDSSQGKGLVFSAVTSTNLTSENFIGITPSAYPTGAGAEIQTKGAVNEEQSGLTAGQSYFVQTDGTLGTTAGSPSVFAGTAVSATKIIVKG